MQSVTALWDSLFNADHKTEYRYDINGLSYYAEDRKGNPVITKPLIDKPAIGRVCTGSTQITVYPKADIPKAALVNVYCRLVSPDGETVSEWLPQGKYYVSSRSGVNPVKLTCKDYMIRAGVTYQDKTAFEEWPQYMTDVLDEICSIMDVELDSRTEINNGYTIDYPNEDTLISEVLAKIAIANGGNWIMTETGKLRLIRLASPGTPVQTLAKAHTGYTVLGKTQLISKVILTDNTNNQFIAGDDTGITIQANCDVATQVMANGLCGVGDYSLGNGEIVLNNALISLGKLTLYSGTAENGGLTLDQSSILYGVSYEPYSVSGAYLNPAVELGDTISVTERNDTVHTVVVYSIKANCTVGFTVALQADINDETEEEFPYITMRQLAINRSVRTDQTYYGNRINRKDGFVSELLVNGESQAQLTANATVFSMQQKVNGRWEDRIYFDTVTGKYVITADVTINGVVTFADLSTSGRTTINGDNITTGKIKNASGDFVLDLDAGTLTVGGKNVAEALTAAENSITLLASSQIFTKAATASTYVPSTITLTASTEGHIASYKWYKDNSLISGQTSSTLSISPTDISGNSATYKVVGTDAAGNDYTDVISIAKLADGAKGDPGTPGSPGAPGTPGTDGTDGVDAYSVLLSNEYIEVPVYSTRIPVSAGSYTCNVNGYKGITALTAVLPAATLAEGQYKVEVLNSVSGITVTQAIAGEITCSVSNGSAANAIPDSSEISLRITFYGGFTVNATILVRANMNSVTVAQQATITAQGDEIALKVNSSGIIAAINLSPEEVTIDAAKINLSGYVTVSSLQNGTTTVDGGCITTGTIDASDVSIINLDADNITAGTLSASYISGGTLDCSLITVSNLSASSITSGTMSANRISGGTINANNVTITNLDAGNISSGTLSASYISGGTLNCNLITVTNLSANAITTGTFSADRISGGTIDASKITVSNINASNIKSGTIDAARINVDTLYVKKLYTASGSSGKSMVSYNGSNTVYVGGDGSSWGTSNTFIYGSSEVCIGSYASWGQKAVFDTSQRVFRPDNSSYGWQLGNSSYPWTIYTKTAQIGSTTGTVGFFGTTPVSKQRCTKISSTSSATAASVAEKINALIDSLKTYGLIASV